MDSLEVNTIKQDLNEQDTEFTSGDGCSKLANNSNLVADSQSHDDDSDLKHLVDDRESPVIIRDETIVQLQNHGPTVPTSIQTSPDQLSDLQSYLVTFNKEIGHGGQPTGYSIGEIQVDSNNLQNSARPVLFSDGQIINVSTSLHPSQGLSSLSDDSKVEISMTTDNLDPQSQTLKLAEALSNSGALLHQTDSVISQSVLSPLSHSPDQQQRTVVLQGLPGAPGTLVQVNVPGKKVLPVVSLEGKEQMQQMQVSMDSMTTVIPQIIHVSQPSEILQPGIEAMKTDVITTVASNSAGMGSLQGIQIGQADITNAQLIALQNAENANPQLVTVNNSQEIQLMGTSDAETGSNANFQTVSIVPTSVDQGGEMNYVLIVSQPDGEKEGGSPKQFALDMGMFQPVFDFKDGQNMVEEVVDDDGTTRKIIRSNSLKAHKLIHSGLKPVFQCELCPTTCGRKTDLKIHMMKLHSNDKPVDCKKCGMVFQDRYSFKLHLKTHDGEKCFKCDQCEYAALSQRHLESHLLTHTGEKPFECDECEQTFRQKQLLKRHKNLYHTPDYSRPEPKEKTYECNLCDKSFANKGNLLRHMQNHDPEYWNKKLGDGGNVALSTEDLIQGSLLNDMRDGKLGSAPKVVIVHPNGSVEEVTSRLQNLVAEKQMEEMMVEVVQDGDSPTSVSTHSLEEAIRNQVEAAIQSHALKALEIAKTNSGDDSATDNLTIDLDRPTHIVTGQPKQTFSRQELEMETESSSGSHNGCITLSTSQTEWDSEHMNKIPDHIVIVKPKDKRGGDKNCI
ncbi:CTCF [Mytilus edulis]|uniref:CTCF n=1 Tax=Mytilus edulis TaxID=6550 RepID=A0A8S3USI4_MYTED|nr:CTCF [Mytilus edulis]